jgi:hypothetical protein
LQQRPYTILLTAMALNLKKRLKHQSKQIVRLAIPPPKLPAEKRLLPL